MRILKRDHELDPSGPQPSGSLLELRIALGIVAAGTVLLAGHEIAESYDHQKQCEIIKEDPTTATIEQLNSCS